MTQFSTGKSRRKETAWGSRLKWDDSIKMDLKEYDGMSCTKILWLGTGTNGGLLGSRQWALACHQNREISWLTEQLPASQDGLCCMELISWLIKTWLTIRQCVFHTQNSTPNSFLSNLPISGYLIFFDPKYLLYNNFLNTSTLDINSLHLRRNFTVVWEQTQTFTVIWTPFCVVAEAC